MLGDEAQGKAKRSGACLVEELLAEVHVVIDVPEAAAVDLDHRIPAS